MDHKGPEPLLAISILLVGMLALGLFAEVFKDHPDKHIEWARSINEP